MAKMSKPKTNDFSTLSFQRFCLTNLAATINIVTMTWGYLGKPLSVNTVYPYQRKWKTKSVLWTQAHLRKAADTFYEVLWVNNLAYILTHTFQVEGLLSVHLNSLQQF